MQAPLTDPHHDKCQPPMEAQLFCGQQNKKAALCLTQRLNISHHRTFFLEKCCSEKFFVIQHKAASFLNESCYFCREGEFKKKQVIAIGKKTGCDVELHPVEIIYNTPSILLFCKYANALLPDPLGRQHLNVQTVGLSSSSSTMCSIALLDVGSAGSACSSSFLSTGSPHCRRRWSSAEGTQNAQTTTHRSHQAHQHLQQITRMLRWFRKSRGVFHSTPRFFLAITCPCCYCCFQPPSFNPCRISCYFFRENMKLHISREQIKKGPYLHFWAPPVQWWGQSRKLDNLLTT